MNRVSGTAAEDFWRRHAAAGILTTWMTTALVLVYAQRLDDGPDRAVLTTLAAGASVASVGFWVVATQAVRRGVQLPVFTAWSLTSMALIIGGVHVDGGFASPLLPLLFVVIVYPAFAYPWRHVLALGLFEIAGTGLVLVGDGSAGAAQKVFLLAGLGLTLGMITIAAHNRGQQERALEDLARRLEEQAVHDELTGCLNRRGFDAALEQECTRASRHGSALALLLLDLDRLKDINDTAGHAAGDAAIRLVASAMREQARRTDVLGRVGGDEFAMLLPETGADEALRLAERVHTHLAAARGPLGVTVSIGAAAGVGAVPGGPEGLLRAADAALYRAKLAGRDRTASARAEDGPPLTALPPQRRSSVGQSG